MTPWLIIGALHDSVRHSMDARVDQVEAPGAMNRNGIEAAFGQQPPVLPALRRLRRLWRPIVFVAFRSGRFWCETVQCLRCGRANGGRIVLRVLQIGNVLPDQFRKLYELLTL